MSKELHRRLGKLFPRSARLTILLSPLTIFSCRLIYNGLTQIETLQHQALYNSFPDPSLYDNNINNSNNNINNNNKETVTISAINILTNQTTSRTLQSDNVESNVRLTTTIITTSAELPLNESNHDSSSSHSNTLSFNDNATTAVNMTVSDTKELESINRYYEQHLQHLLELNATDLESGLPKWMVEYFQWHREMRQQFPDEQILHNRKAPKVMIQHCYRRGKCGGLYDRIKYLPSDILLAAMSQRVLLIKWRYPYPLEEFLTPNLLNWTAPTSLQFRSVNRYLDNMTLGQRDHIDALEARIHATRRIRIVGAFRGDMNRILTEVLHTRQETDFVHNTSTYGTLWRALFRPSPLLRTHLVRSLRTLHLQPRQYQAAHVRARHPGRTGYAITNADGTNADAAGLDFAGPFRDSVIADGVRAVQCALKAASSNTTTAFNKPVYFYSDSDDLVRYMQSHYSNNSTTATADGNSVSDNATDPNVPATNDTLPTTAHSQKLVVVSRPITGRTVHLDLQQGFPVESYVETFVDLYIAALAQCVVYGVGNYGYLASRISGTDCALAHQHIHSERIARRYDEATHRAPLCVL
jgi:hypothetical protein